jgi:hypothetical protein
MTRVPMRRLRSAALFLRNYLIKLKLRGISSIRRVVDIAFESGTEPKCETYQLPEDLVHRVSDLGMSIAVTIYQAGFYSDKVEDRDT